MKVIVLAGGGGTRLFPLSREKYPKQFIDLFDGMSLLQHTLNRAKKLVDTPSDILIMTNKDHIHFVKKQIKGIFDDGFPIIISEPARRNTAPAIALAVKYLLEVSGAPSDEVVAVFPADHIIKPEDRWIDYIKMGESAARNGSIVTFGITPTKPETGYGYIETDLSLKITDGVYAVKRFHEKPDLEKALQYIDKGGFYWNSGVFVFRLDIFIAELARHAQKIYNIVSGYDYYGVLNSFPEMPNISVDYAIMEKSDKVAVVPSDVNWTDLGSFESVYNFFHKDCLQNCTLGDTLAIDAHRNLLISDGKKIVALGVDDLIVADTDDLLLVSRLGCGQRIKEVIDLLSADDVTKPLTEVHTTEHRPWGSFCVLEEGGDSKVKRIVVDPGESISLQYHNHRSEHWVVIRGVATVQLEGDDGLLGEFHLHEDQHIYIPKGKKHRLMNRSDKAVEIIEIQIGDYLGEDDIVRVDDPYNRL